MDPITTETTRPPVRLAIVVSHPIQYYAPWFKHLAAQPGLELKVFYLWDFGVEARFDPGFGQTLQWDIPLLEGYEYVFIPNRSRGPGTHHFHGLDNPGIVPALEAWKPDAILLFGYSYLSHLRVILSRRLKMVPLFLRGDSHDLARPRGVVQALKRRLRAVLFKRPSAFLAVGKANAAYYVNSGVPKNRVHFVPHAVDNDRFQSAAIEARTEAKAWRKELGIPEGALVVLFAGKFETQKRPMDLLEAFLRVEEAHRNFENDEPGLMFVGSGEWEGEMRARAGGRVGHSVFFAPFQNQRQMPMVYAAADLTVLPSQHETWGLTVNEAMNLGRPVIVSDHVGCWPDLVVPGITGWVFPAGNVESLAEVLQHAFTLGRIGLQGMHGAVLQRVSQYSFARGTEALLECLASINKH